MPQGQVGAELRGTSKRLMWSISEMSRGEMKETALECLGKNSIFRNLNFPGTTKGRAKS